MAGVSHPVCLGCGLKVNLCSFIGEHKLCRGLSDTQCLVYFTTRKTPTGPMARLPTGSGVGIESQFRRAPSGIHQRIIRWPASAVPFGVAAARADTVRTSSSRRVVLQYCPASQHADLGDFVPCGDPEEKGESSKRLETEKAGTPALPAACAPFFDGGVVPRSSEGLTKAPRRVILEAVNWRKQPRQRSQERAGSCTTTSHVAATHKHAPSSQGLAISASKSVVCHRHRDS